MARKKAVYVSPIDKAAEFVKDDRFKFVMGLLMLLLSLFALVGFISYLYTWKEDQSKFEMGYFRLLFNSDIHVVNSGSKVGAILAHIFIHNLFGVPSFVFVWLFVLIGLKIYKYEPVPFWSTVKHSIIWIVWSSIFLSVITSGDTFFVGGVFGYEVESWLESVIGWFGTLLLMLICAGAIIMMTVENSVSWVKIFGDDFRKHRNIKTAWVAANTFAKSMTESQKLNAERKQNSTTSSRKKTSDDNYDEVIFEDDNRGDDNMLNSPVNTPNADGGSKGIGSFVRDIFGGKDYVGKEQKIDFNDTQQSAKTSQSSVNTRQQSTTESDSPHSVKERYVIGDNPVAPANTGNTDSIDFEVEDTTESDDEADVQFDAPDPDVQPSEITPGTSSFTATATDSDGESMPLEVETNHDITVTDISNLPPYDPTLDLSDYKLPPVSLLNHLDNKKTVSDAELTENKTKIVNVLKDFRIKLTKIKANIGPTVTLYELTPAPGVKISKIKSLEDDIMMNLKATGIRIIAPIPGRGTVGIEVPNQNPEIVTMESLITSAAFQNSKYELPLAIGKTISNESYVIDLAKCPHLLVAGATGQGKSVGLNAIIASILYKKHPAQVKFVLVDPKKVELTLYNKIEKHFLAKLPESEDAIITDVEKVKQTLNSLTVEMDNRYDLLKEAGCRNIKEYNAKFIARRLNPERGHKFLPYIIVVIDEFADLIMTAGKEVEKPLARIAQLARAIGIHLIVATQRPTTNIITGTIKANFPSRIAFKVSSAVDSKTILDTTGANHLIGRGDMLVQYGSDGITRLQCAFIDTPELEQITEYIGSQRGYPTTYELPEPDIEAGEEGEAVDLSKRDSMFEEAARIIVNTQQGSTSMLQRKLEIGYNRAGRIMDQLEAAGIVGPAEGSKPRKVYIDSEYALEQFIQNLDRSL
jgi:S-DNA-T family DNA segregation ATPase FtsK/SpoIIIE